jgi:hypothetical protein
VPGRKRKEIKGAQPSPNKKKEEYITTGIYFRLVIRAERVKHQTASPAVF